jgi:hypothetical protein
VQLNRATLARQMLLAREKISTLGAIERLVAMQAQLARPPYVGLWTRVQGFKRDDLTKLFTSRKAVRGTHLRGTLHVMSAKDFARFRGAIQPGLSGGMQAILRDRMKGFDLDSVTEAAREVFAKGPTGFEPVRQHLIKKFPKGDERAMGYAARLQIPLLQVPDEGRWGYASAADFTLADKWLGTKISSDESPDDLLLRYLAAFGPASVTDAQTWAGLGRLRDAFERLRPKLVTFRDERGRELFDLPKAPRPDAETDAPVRFLPEFDNILLGHDDRTRVVADVHRKHVYLPGLRVAATLLVDGSVAGTWSVESKKNVTTIVIQPFTKYAKATRDEAEKEGTSLARFMEPDAKDIAVRFA